MGLFGSVGLATGDKDRVNDGVGKIYERTIDVGLTTISIDSIGSMRLLDGKKDHSRTLIGLAVLAFGVVALAANKFVGAIIAVIGLVIMVKGLLAKRDQFLSIGTSDGRSTEIVSKDDKFLLQVRNFIREKIDTHNMSTATINISNSKLEGVIAVGAGARASNGGK